MTLVLAAALCIGIFYVIPLHFIIYESATDAPFLPAALQQASLDSGFNLSFVALMAAAFVTFWLLTTLIVRFLFSEAAPDDPAALWLAKLTSDRALRRLLSLAPIVIIAMLLMTAVAVGVDAGRGDGLSVADYLGDPRPLVLYLLVLVMWLAGRGRDPYAAHATAVAEKQTIPPPPVTSLALQPGAAGVRLVWRNPVPGSAANVRLVREDFRYPNAPDGGAQLYDGLEQAVDDAPLASGARPHYAAYAFNQDGYVSWPAFAAGEALSEIPQLTGFAAQERRRAVALSWNPLALPGAEAVVIRRPDQVPNDAQDGEEVYRGAGHNVSDPLPLGTTGYYAGFVCTALGEHSQPRSDISSVLAAPDVRGFEAVAGVGRIELRWEIPSDTEYVATTICRRDDFAPTTLEVSDVILSGWGQSFSDSSVVVGKQYYYTAFATYATGEIAEGVGVGPVASRTLAAVTNVQAQVSGGVVDLVWENPFDTEFRGVHVVRSATGPPQTPGDGDHLAAGVMDSFSDRATMHGITYYYAIFAHDDRGHISQPATCAVTT